MSTNYYNINNILIYKCICFFFFIVNCELLFKIMVVYLFITWNAVYTVRNLFTTK